MRVRNWSHNPFRGILQGINRSKTKRPPVIGERFSGRRTTKGERAGGRMRREWGGPVYRVGCGEGVRRTKGGD